MPHTWADPGFQVKGGVLKKIVPSGGRRENCWGILCEKSRFYAKKSYFFPIAEGGAKILGGRAPGVPPPPQIVPDIYNNLRSEHLMSKF
jgi:hypothetical protein